MAKIEDLINEIPDTALRDQVAREVKDLKETKRFGLVFEEHIPETVSLHGLPVYPGMIVQDRTAQDGTEFQVLAIDGDQATIVPKGSDGHTRTVQANDLLIVKRFYDPIFPGFAPYKEINNGDKDKPTHIVINGENFHALQALTYAYNSKIDCVYIDPPYNTGDKSWKYNNKFVDDNDSYRHSKWLSFMEKRLTLCKSLLKPDGVIIITIDEHEVHHLGMLIQQIFPSARHQMITIVMSGGTTPKRLFRRVEEYAMYIFFGDAKPSELSVNFLTDKEHKMQDFWKPFVGGSGESQPSQRPNMVYPVIINNGHIQSHGRTLKDRVDDGEIDNDPESLNSFTPPPRGEGSISICLAYQKGWDDLDLESSTGYISQKLEERLY